MVRHSPRFFILCFLSLLMAHLRFPGPLLGLENNFAPLAATDHSGGIDKLRPDRIECSGTIRVDRCFAVILHPGENVVDVRVREGEKVESNQLVARLSNNELLSNLAQLEEKQLELQQTRHRMEALRLKVEIARRNIQRLEQQIEQERQITRQVPEYLAEGKLREWLETKQQKKDDIAIFQTELEQYQALEPSWAVLEKHTAQQIAAIEEQMKRLDLKAPFAGTVTRVHANDRRLVPKDLVVEICQMSALVVVANLWQHQVLHVQPGARAKIYPDFFNGQAIGGAVRSIGTATMPQTQDPFPVFPVEIVLDRVSPNLLAGMSVAVEIFMNSVSEED